ncbi:hypothetical protein EG832_03425 [bacterium]|nr:hypothetical protein [bacterium]
MQTFRRKARLLSALDDEKIKGLFVEIPEEEIYKKANYVFEEFLKGCKTEFVEACKVNAEAILNLYFEKKLPFGDGRKKSEFPDALSLFSLKSYLGPEEKIYVISEDDDLKGFCDTDPQLLSINTLDRLLDLYSQHTNTRTNQIKLYFAANEADIKTKIEEYLEECEVYNSSTWEDAEVDDGLTVISVGDIDPSVIYVSDEECQVTFDIDVEFEVTVTGPDFNNGFYDKEEGRIYTFDTVSRTEIFSRTFTVEIWLNYEFANGNLENVEESAFHISGVSGGIEVEVEETEGW